MGGLDGAEGVSWWLPIFDKNGGKLPFYEFMKLALYDPEHGYYSNLNGLPDFVTAPELTPIFGEVVAGWVAKQWELLGKPAEWGVLEYGAGTGELMRVVKASLGVDRGQIWYGIAEVSGSLGAVQAQKLGDGVEWVKDVHGAPVDLPLVVLGNEVLDAFPVHQYWLEEDGWRELNLDSRLRAELVPVPPPPLPVDWEPELGAIFEEAPDIEPWLDTIVRRLEKTGGALWLADYGYMGLPPEGGDTLQAVQGHKKVPLNHEPGKTDLTAHVDFGRMVAMVGRGDVRDMSEFMLENGLLDLAAKIGGDPVQEAAVRRLIHPAEMGVLFKVLAAHWEAK